MKVRVLVTAAVLVAASVSGLPSAHAAPADGSAATGPLPYSCQVLGQARTFSVAAGTDVPSRLAFGASVAATGTVMVALPEDVTTTIRQDLRAATVDGPAAVPASINKAATPWPLTFPSTAVPATGMLVLSAAIPLGTFAGKKIGRTWRVRIGGDLTTTLRFYRADGSPSSPIPSADITCTLANGKQRSLVQKVTTVKDTTTLRVAGKDTDEGERGKVRIRVASTHGRTPGGEVRVKLFHRGDLVSDRVLELEKGKARLKTRRLDERGWSVTAKFLGSNRFRGSHGSDKIKVR